MADVRVTQQAVEVLMTGDPDVRVTQQAVEVLYSIPPEAAILLPTYNNKKRITNHTNLRR